MISVTTQSTANSSSFGRKIMLSAMFVGAFAGPLVFGLLSGPQAGAQSAQANAAPAPSFEVASIKLNRSPDNRVSIGLAPGKFTTEGAPIRMIIQFAYNIKSDAQISGGPSWINSDKYDIDAKIEDSIADQMAKMPADQRGDQVRLMVQSLLAERFNLKLEHETKDLPIYALVVGKNGPKLTEAAPPPANPNPDAAPGRGGRGGGNIRMMGRGQVSGTSVSITLLADVLSRQLGRKVVDETGLKGMYDFNLQWTPETPTQISAGDASQASAAAPVPRQISIRHRK